jgi:hypothetical protein
MGDSRTSNAGCNGDAGARLKAIALDDLLAPLTQYVTFAADLGESRDGTVDVLGFVGGREPYTDAGFACGHHREGEADNGRASTALGGFLTLALLPPPDASHRPLHALVRLSPGTVRRHGSPCDDSRGHPRRCPMPWSHTAPMDQKTPFIADDL